MNKQEKTDVKETAPKAEEASVKAAPAGDARSERGPRGQRRGPGSARGRGGRPPRAGGGNRQGGERFKPEYDQRVIDLRRVARVVSGGRRFSFRVSVVIGNRKGMVGVGLGKGGDTSLAIEKAVRNARKNMVTIAVTDKMSIPHQVRAEYASAVVEIRPAPGKGLVAGSSIRNVLDLAGVTDVTAKVLSRSKNKLNNARVAVKALSEIKAKKKALPAEVKAE